MSFYSLLYLARALGHQRLMKPLRLAVVSTQIHRVTGEERLCPSKATLLAPCKVIPQEYPNLTCQNIDLALPDVQNGQVRPLLSKALLHDLDQPNEPVIAYRGQYRWIQTFEHVPLLPLTPGSSHFRQRGVYLITGGMGGMGLGLAEVLAERIQARLVLVGRTAIPTADQW
ncbi:MAG: KR domain-containing protein, partial [Ktedonobacteraceae bacterium]